jgi:hypothetical protein
MPPTYSASLAFTLARHAATSSPTTTATIGMMSKATGPAECLTVPPFDHLRSRHAEPEPEAATRETVERHRGHRRGGRRATRQLHDPGADVDA